jgi:N-acetylmuramoyl-L-alanine amidase
MNKISFYRTTNNMHKRVVNVFLCILIFFLSGCGRINDATPIPNDIKEPMGSDNRIEDITPEPTNPDSTITPNNQNEPLNEGAKEKPLYNKIICIDPGHGNPDKATGNEQIAPNSDKIQFGGAYGTQGVVTKTPEYALNMIVSLKLKKALEAEGSIVVMTRMSDEENLSNIERAKIGNDANSDLVIRIHADGNDNKDVRGLSVLYPGDEFIKDEDLLIKSKNAAQFTHDAIVETTGANPRGIIKRNDLIGFNWTTRPVILIEMGFMSNPEEDKLLNDSAYQDKIVQGIVNGLNNYFDSINTDEYIKSAINAKAMETVSALKDKYLEKLSELVHPEKGVRFSPYGYVDVENDLVFSAPEVKGLDADSTIRIWGSYDGTGDPIELTFEDYYKKFIYDVDFANADQIGYNKILGQGNTLINSSEIYKDAIIIEYHFSGFDPQYEGMDWRSLRLAFEKVNDIWYLVGIIHDQWTI